LRYYVRALREFDINVRFTYLITVRQARRYFWRKPSRRSQHRRSYGYQEKRETKYDQVDMYATLSTAAVTYLLNAGHDLWNDW